MKNLALASVLFLPFLLASSAGLVAMAGAAQHDADNGIYLVIAWDRQDAQAELERLGAKILGPQFARFGFFVQAGPQQRQLARKNGHLMVTANTLAAMCGTSISGRQI